MAIKDILSTAFHPRDGRVGDVSRILEGMPDCSGRGQSRGLQSPSLLSLSKVSPLQFKYELFSLCWIREDGRIAQLSRSQWEAVHSLGQMWGFEDAKKASEAALAEM